MGYDRIYREGEKALRMIRFEALEISLSGGQKNFGRIFGQVLSLGIIYIKI